MRFAHVYQLYPMTGDTARRYEVAKKSWTRLIHHTAKDMPFVVGPDTRNAKTLVGDERDVPYVNDMFDYGFSDPTVDAVILTNTDIGFISNPFPYLEEQLKKTEACAMQRLDYKHLTSPPTSGVGGSVSGGTDLFAITRSWWERWRQKLPLMFLGTEGFDLILILAMHMSGFAISHAPKLIFHERHGSYWKKDKTTLLHSPAQKYNRDICASWAKLNGFGYMVNQGARYLFKEMKHLRPVVNAEYDLGVVVLGRYGDIINALPIAYSYAQHGKKVAWAVLPEYRDIFDGVSYVTPITYTGKLQQVSAANNQLKRLCREVQAWQMMGNHAVGKRRSSTFAMEMWRMAGATAQWEELPLVFDRRNLEREQELAARVLAGQQLPLLFSGVGNSSPFSAAAACLAEVRQIAAKYDTPVIDISSVRAERIYDMLGVFERSCGLVVIDSAYLHLTYACRTPTFALTSEGPPGDRSLWYSSQPRCQWRAKATYSAWHEILPELDRWFAEGGHKARANKLVACA